MTFEIISLSGYFGPYALKWEDRPGYVVGFIANEELARLLAAAPELLEACKEAREYFVSASPSEPGSRESDLARMLSAAIKKAGR